MAIMFHIEWSLEPLRLCTKHFASMLESTVLPTDHITAINRYNLLARLVRTESVLLKTKLL